VTSDSGCVGEIALIDARKGKPFPAALHGSVLLSSAGAGWRGIVVEWHRLEPQELPEHYVADMARGVHWRAADLFWMERRQALARGRAEPR